MLKNLEEGKYTERGEPTPGAPTPMGPVLNISKNDQSQDIVSPEDKSSSGS